MLNLVTEAEGTAGGVLIRAVEPLGGVPTMQERRPGRGLHELANGPGKLAAAFGIGLELNRSVLGEGALSVYDAESVPDDAVATSGRVGLSAGHELPLRFYLKDSPFVSRGRTGPLPTRRRAIEKEERS
jgi:DNA-3-methyladenine glycosylase